MTPMRPSVLLHVVLPRKRLVADRTVHALLARVLFPVAGGMSRRRERGCARMRHSVGTGIFVLRYSRRGGRRRRLC